QQERLVEKLQNNKFSIFVGETSDLTNDKWMTFLVRAEMWKKQIPFSNILALSCDNASVMTGKYESLKIKLQKHRKSLITMPCPCHASALVANAAFRAIPSIIPPTEPIYSPSVTYLNLNLPIMTSLEAICPFSRRIRLLHIGDLHYFIFPRAADHYYESQHLLHIRRHRRDTDSNPW
ncbi:hypothetical protein ALC57_00985, partial [Trachymyrmex cornetzi]